MIREELEQRLVRAIKDAGFTAPDFVVEEPRDAAHGDYATNAALVIAKQSKKNPREVAEVIVKNFSHEAVAKTEVAGAGFINFSLTEAYVIKQATRAITEKDFGKNKTLQAKKVMIEYTDPNPFKLFHIGHLMSNAIGETLSRIVEGNGAQVKRACYQGDVGIHVANTLFGLSRFKFFFYRFFGFLIPVRAKVALLGKAYARGAAAYEANKEKVNAINRALYTRSDAGLNRRYDIGRKWSLDYFDLLYRKLGTKFDFHFFESQSGVFGKKVVEDNIGRVFEKSDKAVVFKGETYDPTLHTRVFINSDDIPTYEAKELGLAKIKYQAYPYDTSIVITGNEVNDYFRVLLSAMRQVFPDLAAKTVHISHGMLRLPEGKMSSRTGNVVAAEDLIENVKKRVIAKMKERRSGMGIANDVAVGAIKYSILKQAPGKDIIFDFEKSLSLEGDSGPYLQYAHARACSIMARRGTDIPVPAKFSDNESFDIARRIMKFPDVVARAYEELAPQQITHYAIELAGAFNSYYGKQQIIDEKDEEGTKARVFLTQAFAQTLKNTLFLLGIAAPEKM